MKQNSSVLEQNAPDGRQNGNSIEESSLDELSRNTIIHHLGSFQDNDLDGLVSDYTNESVLITQAATYTGIDEIKAFFSVLILHFPKQKSSFELDELVVKNELVYIVWHGKTPTLEVPLGSDTFIIKDGKIHQQTFAGQLNFIY